MSLFSEEITGRYSRKVNKLSTPEWTSYFGLYTVQKVAPIPVNPCSRYMTSSCANNRSLPRNNVWRMYCSCRPCTLSCNCISVLCPMVPKRRYRSGWQMALFVLILVFHRAVSYFIYLMHIGFIYWNCSLVRQVCGYEPRHSHILVFHHFFCLLSRVD